MIPPAAPAEQSWNINNEKELFWCGSGVALQSGQPHLRAPPPPHPSPLPQPMALGKCVSPNWATNCMFTLMWGEVSALRALCLLIATSAFLCFYRIPSQIRNQSWRVAPPFHPQNPSNTQRSNSKALRWTSRDLHIQETVMYCNNKVALQHMNQILGTTFLAEWRQQLH